MVDNLEVIIRTYFNHLTFSGDLGNGFYLVGQIGKTIFLLATLNVDMSIYQSD